MAHNLRLVKGAAQHVEEEAGPTDALSREHVISAPDGVSPQFRALDVRVIADYACSRGRHMFIAPGTKADVKCPMCGEAASLVAGTERMDKSKRV